MVDNKFPPPGDTDRLPIGDRNTRTWSSLRMTWERYRWLIIGSCWLAAFILGTIGFAEHARLTGEARPPSTLLYLTLQLISMNSGAVSEPIPWQLNLARFLIPFLTAFTALQAFALIFQEQLNLFRLQRMRNHMIICGLGQKGLWLVKGFRQQGERVVVIERDEASDLIEPCRAHGAIVILGDATDQQTLNKAAIGKAKTLIAVCDDSANAEIAVQARQIMQAYPEGALTCILHIVDPQLYNLLRDQELQTASGARFRLELFNVYERGARILVKELPRFAEVSPSDSAPSPCLMVIGLGQLGQSLVVQAARTWWEARHPSQVPLRILAIDLEANWKTEALRIQYPRLSQACDLIPVEMDVRSPVFQSGDFLPTGIQLNQIDTFYICIDDDNLSLLTSLILQRLNRARAAAVVVRITERTGLANLINQRMQTALSPTGKLPAEQSTLRAFVLLEQTCTPDLLLGGTHEVLAREIHAEYLSNQLATGQALYSKDTLAPWDELTEEIKESNRRQVDRIGQKLDAIGCRLAALTDWDAARFEFAAQEVEQMAQMEHAAWVEQLTQEGWRYAPGDRNRSLKTSPDLIAWSELPEPEKEKNRFTVRELPRFLARAGFQIERLPVSKKT